MNTKTETPSRGLHLALWVAQVLLALAFLGAGWMKAFSPMEELVKNMDWARAMPEALVRFIGISELLGGGGLVLPAATRIKPGLTALAAVVMVLAAIFHVTRGEIVPAVVVNAVMGGMAAFIAWGRGKAAPIQPRR
ncbi:MAG: DoxX family protein [Myxococcus sp.]|nr:DoxX family protein [Myxococcus sp.]